MDSQLLGNRAMLLRVRPPILGTYRVDDRRTLSTRTGGPLRPIASVAVTVTRRT